MNIDSKLQDILIAVAKHTTDIDQAITDIKDLFFEKDFFFEVPERTRELTEEEKQAWRDKIEEDRLMYYQHYHVENCECGK